jgi:hypothetical protein
MGTPPSMKMPFLECLYLIHWGVFKRDEEALLDQTIDSPSILTLKTEFLSTKTVFDSHRSCNRACPWRSRACGARTVFLLCCKKWANAHFLQQRKEVCEYRGHEKSCIEQVECTETKHCQKHLRTYARIYLGT